MTKISEEFTYSSINIKTFSHLPIVKGEQNSFLVNDGRNSVVKVLDRKLVHSWTLTHPNSFTCPVIFCNEDQSIYCVMNTNTLLRWSLADDTLKNAAKFKFKESIFAVLPVDQKKPIILFASGKVLPIEILPSTTELLGQDFTKGVEDIIWASTIVQNSRVKVACLSISGKNKIYKLHCFTLHENDYFNQELIHESDVLKCWCLNKATSSFYTMWSSGLILNHQLDAPLESMLLSVPDIQNDHLLGIESISANHIALIKCHPKQKETFLEIWDVKFTAIKAKKNLKVIFSNTIQLSAIDSLIFLSHNEELVEISFQVEKSTLAAVLGGSTITTTKACEYIWNKTLVTQFTKNTEEMDICEVKQNDLNPTELIAQKILKEDSAYLKYIPESELVNLLRLALRYKSNAMNGSDPDVILTSIFSASFSDVFLIKFIKKLNLEEVIVTLETLLSFLNNTVKTDETISRPSDLQLFNWICLLIQSHMEVLLLSKDKKCMKLMKQLDKFLTEKMEEYEDYENILHMFLVIQKKTNILPEAYDNGKYCIETLET